MLYASGSASDDGVPGPLTVTWSQVSGPAIATFTDSGAPTTTASFPRPGDYVLRLTARDGELSASDDVVVTVSDGGGVPTVLDVPVRSGADDAEERPGGKVDLDSSDLELVADGSSVQTVGMRFTVVTVPRGATITATSVTFVADEVDTASASLTIAAQAADDPAAFTTASYRTPDLRPVLQEVVQRSDWASGDPLVLIVTGSGQRTAESYEGGSRKAPVLHLEYTQ